MPCKYHGISFSTMHQSTMWEPFIEIVNQGESSAGYVICNGCEALNVQYMTTN